MCKHVYFRILYGDQNKNKSLEPKKKCKKIAFKMSKDALNLNNNKDTYHMLM